MDSSVSKLVSLPIVTEILERLERELSPQYTFHSAQHSRDVLNEVILFSETESRAPREIELLAIAAAYHDAGFLEREKENEPIGAEIAAEAMERFGGYSGDEIALVKQMICDTRLIVGETGLHQAANNELSRYLLDADVSNFGRADFFDKLERVVQERGGDRTKELNATLVLMKNHDWCTEAARTLRGAKKKENIEELQKMLS